MRHGACGYAARPPTDANVWQWSHETYKSVEECQQNSLRFLRGLMSVGPLEAEDHNQKGK